MTLILVTGLPCAGKTTAARALAAALRLPLFTKDAFKERLFDRLGVRDRAWSKALSRAAFDLLHLAAEAELTAGRSVLIEGNFDPAEESARYDALRKARGCSVVQVLLTADGPELLRRFRARTEAGSRHPGHDDARLVDELAERLLAARAAPLEVEGTVLEVDTTDLAALDIDALVERVRPTL